VSRDGHWLATTTRERGLRLLDLTTGERREFGQPGEFPWQSPTATPDDRGLLASRGHEGLYLIDVRSGAELWRLPLTSTTHGVACSGSRQWFAVATREGIVWLANRKPGSQWQALLGHKNAVNAVAFSPDEKTLASCGADGQVKLWQVETGRELLTLQDNPGENVQCVAFSDDGQVLAAGGMSRDRKGFVRLWYGPRDGKGN
jgi:WD40 repeat protein